VSETPGRATSWRVSAPEPRPPENSTTLSAPRVPLVEDTAHYATQHVILPRVAGKLWTKWKRFAHRAAEIQSLVILSGLYWILVVPIGLLRRGRADGGGAARCE